MAGTSECEDYLAVFRETSETAHEALRTKREMLFVIES